MSVRLSTTNATPKERPPLQPQSPTLQKPKPPVLRLPPPRTAMVTLMVRRLVLRLMVATGRAKMALPVPKATTVVLVPTTAIIVLRAIIVVPKAIIAAPVPTTVTTVLRDRDQRRAKVKVPLRFRGKAKTVKTTPHVPPAPVRDKADKVRAAVTVIVPLVRARVKAAVMVIVLRAVAVTSAIAPVAAAEVAPVQVVATVDPVPQPRQQQVLQVRRELRALPNRKILTCRSSPWAGATVATRGAANIAATTVPDADCLIAFSSAKSRR